MRRGWLLVWGGALLVGGAKGDEPVLTIPEIVVEGEDRALDGPAARDPAKTSAPDTPVVPLDKASGSGVVVSVSLPAEASLERRESAWIETGSGSFGAAKLSAGGGVALAEGDLLATLDLRRRSGHVAGASWAEGGGELRWSLPTGRRFAVRVHREERGLWGAPRPSGVLKTTEVAVLASIADAGLGTRLWCEGTGFDRSLADDHADGIVFRGGVAMETEVLRLHADFHGEPDVYLGESGGRWSRSLSPRSGFWLGAEVATWRAPDTQGDGAAWPDAGAWWSAGETTWILELGGDAAVRGMEETLGEDATPVAVSTDPQVTVTELSGGLSWEHSSGLRAGVRAGEREGDVDWVPSPRAAGTWDRRGRRSAFREFRALWERGLWQTAVQWTDIEAVDGNALSQIPHQQWRSSLDGRRGKLRAGATLRGASTSRSEGVSDLSAWWTLDVRAGWSWSPQWEVGIQVRNTFDASWSRWDGYDEPGRGWSLSMGRRWEWIQ